MLNLGNELFNICKKTLLTYVLSYMQIDLNLIIYSITLLALVQINMITIFVWFDIFLECLIYLIKFNINIAGSNRTPNLTIIWVLLVTNNEFVAFFTKSMSFRISVYTNNVSVIKLVLTATTFSLLEHYILKIVLNLFLFLNR